LSLTPDLNERQKGRAAAIGNNGYIDPRFTFENLVVAPNNETCVLAAKLIVDQPGKIYNPLYIYGGDGLGKTHLIHAIANACIATGKMKVVYKSAEMFLNGHLGEKSRSSEDIAG